MDVPNKVIFFLVVCVLQLAISNVAALDYLVGDKKGWNTNIDYRAWAKNKIFRVGDRLVFKYPTGAHSLVQVKRDAFKNCMAPPTSQALTSGNDVVELTEPGRKYYISDVGDHCSVWNQKLAINVFPVSVHPEVMDMATTPASPLLPFPFMPGPYIPGFPCPPPAPSPGSEMPPGWWKYMFPPLAAPAPSMEFPWKFMFPPSPAPAPSNDFPWKFMFPTSAAPAPGFDFPWKSMLPPPGFEFPWKSMIPPPSFNWKFMFPPSAAPAPSSDLAQMYMFPPAPSVNFPKKLFFPPSTAPAPSIDIPWKWMSPPSVSPALPPTMGIPWMWMFPSMSNVPSSSSP